jgi:hypothetical protein
VGGGGGEKKEKLQATTPPALVFSIQPKGVNSYGPLFIEIFPHRFCSVHRLHSYTQIYLAPGGILYKTLCMRGNQGCHTGSKPSADASFKALSAVVDQEKIHQKQ